MPPKVLVMCAECGRPQFATQATCVACGAALPDTPVPKEELASARDRLLQSYEPYLEGSLGRGRRLLLSDKRLEWHGGGGQSAVLELSELKRVRVDARPVFESLLFAAGLAAAALVTPWLALRLVLGGLSGLAVVACFAQRRYDLVLESAGARRRFLLGIGTRRAPISQRIESIWSSFREELSRLGIATS